MFGGFHWCFGDFTHLGNVTRSVTEGTKGKLWQASLLLLGHLVTWAGCSEAVHEDVKGARKWAVLRFITQGYELLPLFYTQQRPATTEEFCYYTANNWWKWDLNPHCLILDLSDLITFLASPESQILYLFRIHYWRAYIKKTLNYERTRWWQNCVVYGKGRSALALLEEGEKRRKCWAGVGSGVSRAALFF